MDRRGGCGSDVFRQSDLSRPGRSGPFSIFTVSRHCPATSSPLAYWRPCPAQSCSSSVGFGQLHGQTQTPTRSCAACQAKLGGPVCWPSSRSQGPMRCCWCLLFSAASQWGELLTHRKDFCAEGVSVEQCGAHEDKPVDKLLAYGFRLKDSALSSTAYKRPAPAISKARLPKLQFPRMQTSGLFS